MVCVLNATPIVRPDHRLGVPHPGTYRVVIDTDAAKYGGSGISRTESLVAQATPSHGMPFSIVLSLPPLGVTWLTAVAP